MFANLKSIVVCSNNNNSSDDEEITKPPSSRGTHSHSNSNDSSVPLVGSTNSDLKSPLVVDDVSDSNAKMIANQSETIRKSVRTLSNSLPQHHHHHQVTSADDNDETILLEVSSEAGAVSSRATSKKCNIDNPIIASRFDLIDNASDVSMTGDTFKLIASDIVRLIPNMKVDGIKLVESLTPSSDEIEEATLRLFGQLFQNLGLIECCRADLFNTKVKDHELTIEMIKNDMISTMENVWRELESKPHRLQAFKNILKILSCMQQESISKSMLDIKSKFKSVHGGKVRLFDGRMWVVELYFNNSSIEVVHYRTEKLCSSGGGGGTSKTAGESNSTTTPRASSGIEEVCKFVWSNTFTFQLDDEDDDLVLDSSRSMIDFQSVESLNDNLEIVKSFLVESEVVDINNDINNTNHQLSSSLSSLDSSDNEESSSRNNRREEYEKLLVDYFHNFFKFNNNNNN